MEEKEKNELVFTKNQIDSTGDKITFIYSLVDTKNKQFYVHNTNKMPKSFIKDTKDLLLDHDKDKVIYWLNNIYHNVNSTIEFKVETFIDMSNHHNTDQKEINKFKNDIANKHKYQDGFTEN